jgi:hypothetical protein
MIVTLDGNSVYSEAGGASREECVRIDGAPFEAPRIAQTAPTWVAFWRASCPRPLRHHEDKGPRLEGRGMRGTQPKLGARLGSIRPTRQGKAPPDRGVTLPLTGPGGDDTRKEALTYRESVM